MIVSKELRETLINSAKKDYADKANAHLAAQTAMNEARKVLEWAQALKIGDGLTVPTVPAPIITYDVVRYFVPSKSGLTKGHFIYRYSDGSVSCTCPGFVNRNYCWASTKVKDNRYAFGYWKGSKSVFDNNRNLA